MGKLTDQVSIGPPPHSLRLSKLPFLLCMVSSGSQGPWPNLGTAGCAVLSCHSTMCFRMLASTHTLTPQSCPEPTGLTLAWCPPQGWCFLCDLQDEVSQLSTEHLGVAPPCSQRAQEDNHLGRKQTHALKGRAPNQTSKGGSGS